MISLDETLVLNPQVLNFIVTLLELDLDLVAFLLGSLQLANQYVFVHLDFFLTLFHGHFKLILSIFETIDLVCTSVDFFTQALNFKLHNIVLNKCLLLLLDYSLEIATGHLVFELKFSDDAIESSLL